MASVDLITKLADDADAVDAALTKMQKQVTKLGLTESGAHVSTLRDKKLAQALKMGARGDKGRAGPKENGIKEYNHIHVGGNAKYNLLFQPNNKLILGTLNFHLDSSNSDLKKREIKKGRGARRGQGNPDNKRACYSQEIRLSRGFIPMECTANTRLTRYGDCPISSTCRGEGIPAAYFVCP